MNPIKPPPTRSPKHRSSGVASRAAAETPVDGTSHPPPRALSRVARGSTINLAGAVVAAMANFGLTVLVTRLTSQSTAGIFFSVTSLFLLATSLGQLGTNTGLVYFLSGARARGELHRYASYMRVALRPVLVVGVVMAVAMFVFAGPLARVLASGHEAEFTSYLRAVAIFIPCAGLLNLAVSGTRGLGTMRINALLDQMGRPVLQVGLVLLAIVFGGRSAVLAVGWAVPYVILAGVGWRIWTTMRVRAGGATVDHEFRPTKDFWRFSVPRALASVAQVAMQRLDVVLVGALAGIPEAALYAAATRFLALGQMAGGAVSQSVQPHLGETLARKDVGAASELYQVSTAWLVCLTWPIYLLLIVFAPTVLDIFGSQYDAGSMVVIILCSSMLLGTACGMVDMVLTMAGRTSWNLVNVLIAFAINLSLDLLLIPSHGITGAAIGWAVAIVAANVIPLLQVGVFLRLHPFGPGTITALVLASVCFGAVPVVGRALIGPGWWSLFLSAAVGFVAYLVGLRWCRKVLRLHELLALRGRGRPRPAAASRRRPGEERRSHEADGHR